MRRLVLSLLAVLALLPAGCATGTTTPAPVWQSPMAPSWEPATTPELPASPSPQTVAPTPADRPTATPPPPPSPTATPTATPPPAAVGPFALVAQVAGRPAGRIRSLRMAPDGTLWLATEQGVGSYMDGVWTLHLERDAALAGIDAAGRVYVGLDGGAAVAVWDSNAWTFYGQEEGWSTPLRGAPAYGEEPAMDRRGWVWLTTCEDVRSFDGTRWTVHTSAEIGFSSPEPEYICLQDVAVDSTGDVWVGECEEWGAGPSGDGARWFDGQAWQGAGSARVGSGTGCVRDIEVDAAGRIWARLWRYTPGQGWEYLGQPELPEGVPRWGVPFALDLDANGELWALLDVCGGASCFNGFHRYRLHQGQWIAVVGEHWRGDLAFGPDGTAWVCADGAVYHVVEASAEYVGEIPAAEGRCDLEVGPSSRVWAAVLDTAGLYTYDGP